MFYTITKREPTTPEIALLVIAGIISFSLLVYAFVSVNFTASVISFIAVISIGLIVPLCAYGSMEDERKMNEKQNNQDYDKFIDRL